MSSQSFADLGVSQRGRPPPSPSAASPSRSPSRRSSSPTCSPAATSSPSRRPARARRWPSASRCSTASTPTATAARRRSSSPRRASSPRQIVDELYPLAHARALKITTVYGGVGITSRSATRSTRTSSSPRPAASRTCCSAASSSSTTSTSWSSTRPTACSTWASARPSTASSPQCPRERQTLFLSATLDGEAGRVARSTPTTPPRTRSSRRRPHRRRSSTASSRSSATTASTRWSRELRAERDLALVFVRTKHGADRLVKRLSREGVKAVAMHGDKSQRQRERALAQFERGEVDTLVATDVAARGIDVRDISHVINFDPPEDGDTYTHRVAAPAAPGAPAGRSPSSGTEQARDVQKMAARARHPREFGQQRRCCDSERRRRPSAPLAGRPAPGTTGARAAPAALAPRAPARRRARGRRSRPPPACAPMARDVQIRGDMIRLGQLLKLSGVVDGGRRDQGPPRRGAPCSSTASPRTAAGASCTRATSSPSRARSCVVVARA